MTEQTMQRCKHMKERALLTTLCFLFPVVTNAESIRGFLGFELSSELANYDGLEFIGTSDDEWAVANGERWRLFQIRGPLRRYYRVRFSNVPAALPVVNAGVLSAYEGWVATITAKSNEYDSVEQCYEKRDEVIKVLSKAHGQPLTFRTQSYFKPKVKFARYKHHEFLGVADVWESDNSIMLWGCQPTDDDRIQFDLVYESSLWQKTVENWRHLMGEQRRIEKE